MPVNRQNIVVGTLVLSAAELGAAVRFPGWVAAVSAALGLVVFVAALIDSWRKNGRLRTVLLSDPVARAFSTPRHPHNPMMGLAVIQFTVTFLAMTAYTWVGLLGGAGFALLAASQWRTVWYGAGLTFRPEGLVAEKPAGVLTIPWEALAPEPAARGDEWFKIKLTYDRPELVTRTGWMLSPRDVVFEGVDPDLVVKAIGTYATQPDRRARIGSTTELALLREGFPDRPRKLWQFAAPATRDETIGLVVFGLILVVIGGFLDAMDGWPHWIGFPLTFIGAGLLVHAFTGWRAARAARHQGEAG